MMNSEATYEFDTQLWELENLGYEAVALATALRHSNNAHPADEVEIGEAICYVEDIAERLREAAYDMYELIAESVEAR